MEDKELQELLNLLNKGLKEKGIQNKVAVVIKDCVSCGAILQFEEVGLDYYLSTCEKCQENTTKDLN